MDTPVIEAIAKWPNVPDVFGWLSLDRRGEWRLRGERISHRGLKAFIGRNYAADAIGRWYFQNGPQRVYVALEATPWIWRLQSGPPDPVLIAHTGQIAGEPQAAWCDESGNLLILTGLGIGLLCDRDLAAMSPCLHPVPVSEAASGLAMTWGDRVLPIGGLESRIVAARFGFDPSPAPPHAG